MKDFFINATVKLPAQTGMLLRDSEYAGGSSYKAIAAELERVDGLHGDPYKEEFLYLVKRLAAM